MLNGENVKMFADECVVYKSGMQWSDIRNSMQSMLDKYITLGTDNNLLLNVGKT